MENEPCISSECGVQTNEYRPEASWTLIVFVPTKSTPVNDFETPGAADVEVVIFRAVSHGDRVGAASESVQSLAGHGLQRDRVAGADRRGQLLWSRVGGDGEDQGQGDKRAEDTRGQPRAEFPVSCDGL